MAGPLSPSPPAYQQTYHSLTKLVTTIYRQNGLQLRPQTCLLHVRRLNPTLPLIEMKLTIEFIRSSCPDNGECACSKSECSCKCCKA